MKNIIRHIMITGFLLTSIFGFSQDLIADLKNVSYQMAQLNKYEIKYVLITKDPAVSEESIIISKCGDNYYIESSDQIIITSKDKQLAIYKDPAIAYYSFGSEVALDPKIVIKQITPLLSIAEKVNFVSTINEISKYEIVVNTEGLKGIQISIDTRNKRVVELQYDFEQDVEDQILQLKSFRYECLLASDRLVDSYLSGDVNGSYMLLPPYQDYELFMAPSNNVK